MVLLFTEKKHVNIINVAASRRVAFIKKQLLCEGAYIKKINVFFIES